jgi:hypothetical protein
MKKLIVFALFATAAFGQTTTTPATTPAATVNIGFPAAVLPAGIAAFAEFNQLGNPRWTGGISLLYPIAGSVGVYGSTTADVSPKLATDPPPAATFTPFNRAHARASTRVSSQRAASQPWLVRT